MDGDLIAGLLGAFALWLGLHALDRHRDPAKR